jgi:hypothetical protein
LLCNLVEKGINVCAANVVSLRNRLYVDEFGEWPPGVESLSLALGVAFKKCPPRGFVTLKFSEVKKVMNKNLN